MKRRKRTSKKIPAKGRLRDMADQLWSLAVKDDWACRCAVCGRREKLNSHHLLPRQHQATRYELMNGVCLCRHCHQFDANISPHQNAAGWLYWLSEHHPAHHRWYTEQIETGAHRRFNGTTNAVYYCDVIRELNQYVHEVDYDRIVGIKFGQWIEEQE